MFEIEILHNLHGDKRKKIDTSTEAGRAEAATICKKMLKQGTAIFLERGKKTYRVKDYDPEKDQLIVAHEAKGDVKAKATKGKKTAVAPVAGGAGESRLADEETVPVEIDCARLREMGATEQQCQQILDDMDLSDKLQDVMMQMAAYVASGGEVTREDLFALLNDVAADNGCYSGIPMPAVEYDIDRRLVLAPQTPLGITNLARPRQPSALDRQTRNRWTRLGDESVLVVNTEEGPMWFKIPHAGERLRKFMDTALLRCSTQQSAAAELRAMRSLRKRINERQYESYVLNGCFPEISDRSGVHYVFRKGYPTLAVSYHGKKNSAGRVLAALCLHPQGYYEGTFCGLMNPTDEVIAALVMMRADERRYWAKSGQWSASDLRSGL
jgi:hypothetical protein